MSQVSIIDIESNQPQIPTQFNANIGFAIPIGNILEILGNTVPAGTNPVFTTGAGNTIITNVQISQAIASTDATKVGLASFDESEFSVDANGFVKFKNSYVDQAETIGDVTADITTIPLTVAGTYTFESRGAAWESTGPGGAGFSINGVIRSDGVTATLIGDSDGFTHTDDSLDAADVNIIASGNNAIVRVKGVSGLTIEWAAFTVYVFRGV